MIKISMQVGTETNAWLGWSPVESTTFKDGCPNPRLNENQCDQLNYVPKVCIKAFIQNMTEMFNLILVVDAVRRIRPDVSISLILPYLPFARQDRVCNEGEAIGIAAFARVLNSLNFESVTLYDPHSDVAAGVIDRCVLRDLSSIMLEEKVLGWMDFTQTWLVAPDAGAVKRVKQLAKRLNAAGVITASKVRDTETLELTKTKLDEYVQGRNLLVVDDLCDGGRTFIALAKAIREQGEPKSLILWATHGIFSYGTEVVTEHYDRVYTTNSFQPEAKYQIDGEGNYNPKMYWYVI